MGEGLSQSIAEALGDDAGQLDELVGAEFKEWEPTGGLEFKAMPVTGFKVLNDGQGTVECLVSVTGIVDRVKDIIEPGAYAKTLAQRTPKGVWSHQWDQPVSKTVEVDELLPGDARLPRETKNGEPWPREAGALRIVTQFNLDGDRGRQAYADVKFFGDEQEWSIGYNVPAGGARIESKTGIRRIQYLDLFEYSPVLFGAMPEAVTTDVKTAQTAYRAVLEVSDETKRVDPKATLPPPPTPQHDEHPHSTPAPKPTPKPAQHDEHAHPTPAAMPKSKPKPPAGGGSAGTTDASGHAHRPVGPQGGQFAPKGGGSSSGTVHAHKGGGRSTVHAHSHTGPHAHPATAGPGGTHTVAKGDTLWALAGKLLGDPTRWREIAALNGVKDPKQLHVGAQLKLPGPHTAKPAIGKVGAASKKALPVFDEGNGPIYDHESMAQPAEELNEDDDDAADGAVDTEDDDTDEKEDIADVNDDDASALLDTMRDNPYVQLDADTGDYDDVDENEFVGAEEPHDDEETKQLGPDLESKAAGSHRGNAETLRRYWAEGEGAAKIRWGEGGDWARCVAEVDKYMPGRAKGYCNLLHHRALGYYPATHAAMDGKSVLGAVSGPGGAVPDAPTLHALIGTFAKRARLTQVMATMADGSGGVATLDVPGAVYGVKVRRADAMSDSAQVIEIKALGDGTALILPGDTMREAATVLAIPVPEQAASPEQTGVKVGPEGGDGSFGGVGGEGSVAQQDERIAMGQPAAIVPLTHAATKTAGAVTRLVIDGTSARLHVPTLAQDATLEEFGVKTAYLPCAKCHSKKADGSGHCANCGAKLAPKFGAKQCMICEAELKMEPAGMVCDDHGLQTAVWELKDVSTESGPPATSLGFDFGKAAVITHCPVCGSPLDEDGDCPNGDYSNASKAAKLTAAERRDPANHAMGDGSFPIPDVAHLKSAVHLFQTGHTGADAAKTKAHITAQATRLGATDALPDDWDSKAMTPTTTGAPTAADYKFCPLCGSPLTNGGYCANDQYSAKIDDIDLDAAQTRHEAKVAAELLRDMAVKLDAGEELDRGIVQQVADSLDDVLDSELPGEKSDEAVDLTADLMEAQLLGMKAAPHLEEETKEEVPPFVATT